MKKSFKIGDLVICIKRDLFKKLQLNKLYTISKTQDTEYCYKVKEITDYSWFYIDKFIKVNKLAIKLYKS